MTNYTPRALSTNRLQWVISQVAHGFSVGHILRFNGASYVRALADTAANARVIGMVSLVLDADRFVITQEGFITALTIGTPLVAGTRYYLSPSTLGTLTSVAPSNVGEVVLPLFDAVSTTSGYFSSNPGDVVEPPSIIPWQTIVASQAIAANNNYWTDSLGVLTLSMPPSMGTSDAIEVACPANGGGFIIDFNPGQVCDFVDQQTSSGGTIALTTTLGVIGGSIKINCHTTDTGFMITSSTGNFIVA